MTENSIAKRQNNKSQLISRTMIVLYFAVVIALGAYYAFKSMGGNLGTIISYFKGMKDFPNDALIYTSILESVFISLAIAGSILSVMILILTSWKLKTFPVVIHICTTLTYIVSRVALVQATVHLSTQGAIKNTEFWDFKMIFQQIIGSSTIFRTSSILLIGIIIVPFLLRLEGRLNDSEYKI
tara:strand:- start:123 stop:671 length:549 start_codon:yes stop_codon:yes gene_type:complete